MNLMNLFNVRDKNIFADRYAVFCQTTLAALNNLGAVPV